jgi:3-hydroxyisobutyrate dehydrogenase-like beta-hydroxyacid dehydrogenase
MSAASMKLYTQAVEAGKGDLDFSAVAQLFLK